MNKIILSFLFLLNLGCIGCNSKQDNTANDDSQPESNQPTIQTTQINEHSDIIDKQQDLNNTNIDTQTPKKNCDALCTIDWRDKEFLKNNTCGDEFSSKSVWSNAQKQAHRKQVRECKRKVDDMVRNKEFECKRECLQSL